jgi:arylsulfatase A-like enzyme
MRVVVLTISGLQPAYLGAYGCEWVPTPTVDHWATTGVVFDYHYADRPAPTAVRQAWGLTNDDHDLPTRLREVDVASAYVGPRGLGRWDATYTVARDAGPISLKATRRAVRQAVERLADSPRALLWVEVDALLPPWHVDDDLLDEFFTDFGDDAEDEQPTSVEPWTGDPPPAISGDDEVTVQRLQRTYAAAVAGLDQALGRLWKDCAKSGWGDEAYWLVTGDVGFPLGEHSVVGPAGSGLHEELVHVPLLVRWPDGQFPGLRVGELTQSADVATTITDLFGCPRPSRSGHSLLALARGDGGPIRQYVTIRKAAWAVRTADWYLLVADSPDAVRQLFVKPDDRWEVNNLAQHHSETVARLEALAQYVMPPE